MIEVDAERLVSMAQSGLRLEPPPSEEEVERVLGALQAAFGVAEDIVREARHALHARFQLQMDKGQTIVSDDEHEPWLARRQAGIDPFYWERYRKSLEREGRGPYVVSTLNKNLDEILNLLGDPDSPRPWKRRGLVVGDVQSGKTATYAGLINKASDAGYRMIILLTGTLENVRRQTQERLDAAFVGFDSRDYLTAGQLQRKRHIGVGLIDGRRDGVVFTSRDKDFRKNTATQLNIGLDSVKDPVLVVSKKNKAVLERLASWLGSRNADREGRIDLPLLLIDDEADNASINTKNNPREMTAINTAIRRLLTLFKRSSYVGFTATPFANIFIDPENYDDILDDDIFPRHFIHLLEPPNNYFGMGSAFPVPEGDEDEVSAPEDLTQEIDDESNWLPVDHKKDHVPGPLPETLRQALNWYLLSCAIRDLRYERGDSHKGGPIHRSMLINVSRFTDIQDAVARDVQMELERIQLAVRHHGRKHPDDAEASASEIATLREVFDVHGYACGFQWGDVLGALHEAIAPVQVQPINQRTGSAVLDYGAVKAPPGIRVIAVGGNSLSRGITLEGLTVSYFLRNSKAYDTLLQMGRWFGYRDGYEDLCRLWMTAEAEGWYRHITMATNELKRDFRRMRLQKATPREFGLRVRTHPDTLIITARNKMASGVDIVAAVQDVSLTGRGIETARLHRKDEYNTQNLSLVEQFLTHLCAQQPPQDARDGHGYLWTGVPAEQVAEFVEQFLVHLQNHDFQGDSIAAHLRNAAGEPGHPWAKWKVALPRKGKDKGDPWRLDSAHNLEVTPNSRIVLPRGAPPPPSLLISGKNARVGSRSDVLYGLTGDEEQEALAIKAREFPDAQGPLPEDIGRSVMSCPLLLIYLVRGKLKDGSIFDNGKLLPALGLHFPGERDPNARKHYIRYRLNRVAQIEQGLVDEDVPADEDTDD
ncbi:MAG: endonuclease [Alphaproteobacteria bacterium]|jgi:hypothetical protein|nr:endonuclease [Alphaproteobacteria bacterium]